MNLFTGLGATPNLSALGRRYLWTAGVVAVLAMIIGLLEGVGVSLLIPLLSVLNGGTSSGSQGTVAWIQRIAEGYSRDRRLMVVSSVILGFVLLKSAFQISANIFASWVDGRVGQDIRCGLSKQLQSVGYPFFLLQQPARLVNIITTESWKASDAVRVLLTRISATAAVAVFSLLLLLVSWRLSVIVLIGGLIARGVQGRFEAKLRRLSKHTVAINELLADRMLFAIFGARLIRLFNDQVNEHQRFEVTSDGVRRAILRGERVSGTQGPVLEAMHGVLFLTVLLIAIFRGVSMPVLIAFLVLMNRLQPHLRALEQSTATFASAAAHFNEVEWLLDPHGKPPAPSGEVPFEGLRSEIRFQNVSFEYADRHEPALADANFVLRRGRSTALIGGSGAGKSTIINLLCRLLEPTGGTILVDGESLSRIRVSDWLSHMAIAGQDVDLFDGTILENISYGRPEVDVEAAQAVARMARADFIFGLPQGLGTLVGPRGLALSGGQRQRIGIARALARKPDLLILDEATNAIDHDTETELINMLRDLPKSITTIVISHRMSTLAFCDDAVVLNRGRVVESGSLSALLNVHGGRANLPFLEAESV